MRGHTGKIYALASVAGERVVSASGDRTVRFWLPASAECLAVLEGHRAAVLAVAAVGNGHCISGAADRTLRLWDLAEAKCMRVLEVRLLMLASSLISACSCSPARALAISHPLS